jgi:leucyl/phenylalanyl-tRNA---protein transferase
MDITNSLPIGYRRPLIYKQPMSRQIICLLLAVVLSPALAFATCEGELQVEFNRAPDDSHQGFITDQVALSPQTISVAYQKGIFPWSVNDRGLGNWFSPPVRGVLSMVNVDIPHGDRKAIRKLLESGKYQVKYNTDFLQVITECALQSRFIEREVNGEKVKIEDARWITDDHIEQFTALHRLGQAHSVEVWEGDQMVGGMYGVFVNGYFSGESMFHKASDVTKLAYYSLIERLKSNGHSFIDTQQNRGLTKKWGGAEISRGEFLQLLEFAKERNNPF